jgi:hypothetical protein
VDQGALDALDAAIARVEEERKLALDFQSPRFLPSEWGSTEAEYGSISVDRTSTGAVQAAEGQYRALADTYHELFQNALPLYADYLVEEGLKLRDQAIAGGIEDLLPEYLVVADEKALDAEDAYLAEDYYTALAEALEALDRYRSLALGVDAYLVREEVVRLDYSGFDPVNFDRADETLIAAADAYETGLLKEALTGAGEAKTLYDQVLKAGGTALARLAGLEQEILKTRADAIAAGIEDYAPEYLDEADDIALAAEAALLAKDYVKALAGGEEALTWYKLMVAAMDVVQLRDEAIAAGIEDYAPEYLDEADDIALDALDAFLVKDYAKAQAGVEEAAAWYGFMSVAMDVVKLRDEAIAAGIEVYGPEYLDEADDIALDALDTFLAKDYNRALAGADEALDWYYALQIAAEVLKVREDAIAAGIEVYGPEYLDEADDIALAAEDAFLAKDYDRALAGADEALDWYHALQIAAEVLNVREDAIAAGIDDYAPGYIDLADEFALDAEDAFLALDYDKAEAGADEALDWYNALQVGAEELPVRDEG